MRQLLPGLCRLHPRRPEQDRGRPLPDTNDLEGGDTIVYDGTTVIETGNNAEYGYFLDKPDIEVDVLRPGDPGNQCGHRVYVTYSTFNGLTKDEKFQTKMNFASAE